MHCECGRWASTVFLGFTCFLLAWDMLFLKSLGNIALVVDLHEELELERALV